MKKKYSEADKRPPSLSRFFQVSRRESKKTARIFIGQFEIAAVEIPTAVTKIVYSVHYCNQALIFQQIKYQKL